MSLLQGFLPSPFFFNIFQNNNSSFSRSCKSETESMRGLSIGILIQYILLDICIHGANVAFIGKCSCHEWIIGNRREAISTYYLVRPSVSSLSFYPFQENYFVRERLASRNCDVKDTYQNPIYRLDDELGELTTDESCLTVFDSGVRYSAGYYLINILRVMSVFYTTSKGIP